MHNAPPVIYPVGRFVWCSCGVGALALTGAVGLMCWHVMSGAVGLMVWIAWALWAVSSTLALWLESRESSAPGHLVWRGDGWCWQDQYLQEHPVQLSLLLDGGRTLWVSYRVAQGLEKSSAWPQFTIVAQTDMPLAWHGFRCAVYSRPLGDDGSLDPAKLPMVI